MENPAIEELFALANRIGIYKVQMVISLTDPEK